MLTQEASQRKSDETPCHADAGSILAQKRRITAIHNEMFHFVQHDIAFHSISAARRNHNEMFHFVHMTLPFMGSQLNIVTMLWFSVLGSWFYRGGG